MFCPKCGTENTGEIRFCRKCGAELETVAALIAGKLIVNKPGSGKGFFSTPSWEKAMLTMFLGVALLVTSFVLGFDLVTGFPTAWLALLIIAFPMVGLGIAQIIRASMVGREIIVAPSDSAREIFAGEQRSLPESRTDYVSPQEASDFRTADLVPSSVTEGTTRHLEMEEKLGPDDLGEREK